ncbi:electron transport complex subunit RsxC [Agarivorans albus]|uniref:Ion-translocating oxidoreductase complex subunit C n=1 Tax=Agarivorans albus MKT 106 TaxID=1331007 RepID=R9PT25_AGAAL|nr:electron transport complex subunit RsxC [Agarivorans albus]GAD01681.1 electron transport complex protein RnfC [Agarivorans albus MKT 106]
MVAWLDKIKQGFTWNYKGGVHPETNKQDINCGKPELINLPNELSIPVQQHIGSAGKLLVKVGDKVLRGQALTESQFFQAPPVHASLSGEIIAIEPRVSAHASAIPELSVVIRVDKAQQDAQWPSPLTDEELTPEAICQRVHLSGISGMGGAGFPTALKITPHKPLDVLIINGAECEPYISADDCLMQNYAAEIIGGVALLQKVLKPALTIVAVEDDKPKAIKALEAVGNQDIIIRSIPTKYPSGGEKQLIQVLTGKEVKANQLPIDLGMLVQNVGTAYAVYQAVTLGEPLISRVVTLAGDLVTSPSNYWVPIGTAVSDVINKKLQGEPNAPTIMGGSMMGFMLPSNQAPVVKTTNCLIVNNPMAAENESPCIRCGECAQACPMGLLPQQLYWYAKGDELNKARDFNIMDCIECGACAFVCPSEISLVQHYRTAKAKIRSEDIAQKEADIAKQRFDARQARLEKDKLERKAKHQQAALRRQAQTEDNAKQNKPDPVAAALARVKNKQAASPAAKQDETGEWVPDNQAAIAAREARKAERRAQKEANESKASANPAVAAAIARAKAKKQTDNSESINESKPSANPAVAAAIARAKAKKQQNQDNETTAEDNTVESSNSAVAAAVARAKAKKAQAQQQFEPTTATNPAVAAAVARAKAKKLANKEASADQADDNLNKPAAKSSANPAVAAAIARAKAKKTALAAADESVDTGKANNQDDEALEVPLAREQSVQQNTQDSTTSNNNAKAKAIAAAVAKAKANKKAEDATEAPTPATVEKPAKKVNPAVAAAVARAKAKKLAEQQREEKDTNE